MKTCKNCEQDLQGNFCQNCGQKSTVQKINYNYLINEVSESVFFSGIEFLPLDFDDVRSQPRWIVQLDIDLRPIKRIRLLLENTFMSSSLSRNFLLYDNPNITNPEDFYTNPGFYTLDGLISYQFNKNLVGYMKIHNYFNKKYAGIDATEDGDGLLYNPQSRRFVRFGVNYRLE